MAVLLRISIKFWLPLLIMCLIMVMRLFSELEVEEPLRYNGIAIKHLSQAVTMVIVIVLMKL